MQKISKILRYFRYHENDLPAIINANYGQGNAILSAIRFEYDLYLIANNQSRLKLINDLLKYLI